MDTGAEKGTSLIEGMFRGQQSSPGINISAEPGRVDLGGSPPRPPTDPDVHVNASGSSSQDFAAPLSRPWTTRAGGRR